MKLIMENWRKFKKINENMEKVHALSDKYPKIPDKRLSELAFIVQAYLRTFFEPQNSGYDEKEAFKSLKGEERSFADDLVALNREEFGSKAGGPPEFETSQNQEDVELAEI